MAADAQTDRHNQLCEQIDESLCYIWDPAWASTDPASQTRYEYGDYIDAVANAVEKGCTTQQLAQFLDDIAAKHMGLGSDIQYYTNLAAAILDEAKSLSA